MQFFVATFTGGDSAFTGVFNIHPIKALNNLNLIRNTQDPYLLSFYAEITGEEYHYHTESISPEHSIDYGEGTFGYDLTTPTERLG